MLVVEDEVDGEIPIAIDSELKIQTRASMNDSMFN